MTNAKNSISYKLQIAKAYLFGNESYAAKTAYNFLDYIADFYNSNDEDAKADAANEVINLATEMAHDIGSYFTQYDKDNYQEIADVLKATLNPYGYLELNGLIVENMLKVVFQYGDTPSYYHDEDNLYDCLEMYIRDGSKRLDTLRRIVINGYIDGTGIYEKEYTDAIDTNNEGYVATEDFKAEVFHNEKTGELHTVCDQWLPPEVCFLMKAYKKAGITEGDLEQIAEDLSEV